MNKPHIATVEGRWGKCAFFAQDEFIGKAISSYGEYNPDETEFILKLAAQAGKDRRVLDVGANIGAIAQALEFSGFTVEAFEPQPEVFALLRRNFSGRAHNVALGAQAELAIMPRLDYAQKYNFGGVAVGTASRANGAIRVKVETLDSYGFTDVGLVKVDVEGFEEQVLRGGAETISRCSPVLYLEDDRVEKREGLHNFLRELGYRWESHQPPLYRPKNFFGRAENVWDRNFVSFNIVCYR